MHGARTTLLGALGAAGLEAEQAEHAGHGDGGTHGGEVDGRSGIRGTLSDSGLTLQLLLVRLLLMLLLLLMPKSPMYRYRSRMYLSTTRISATHCRKFAIVQNMLAFTKSWH